MSVGAVIVAAGSSTRMGGVDKMLLRLGGRTVIEHSVTAFADHPRIDAMVVVTSEANREAIRALFADNEGVIVTGGGARRRDSVLRGLDALDEQDVVVIHDGARPLVTPGLIDAAIDGATETGASLCAVPVTDTVKRGDPTGLVASTVSREGLWLAQTPQAFRADLLRRAHAATDIDATDDAALVELLGEPVRLVQGDRENIKLTTQDDVRLAEAIMNSGRA